MGNCILWNIKTKVMGILWLYSQNMLVEIAGNCSGGWSQFVSLLRGNSEGSAGQFEPAEDLTRCWSSTVEFTKQYVLLSFKKNAHCKQWYSEPAKQEGDYFTQTVIRHENRQPPQLQHDLFTAQSANPLYCFAGIKSHQVMKSFGKERARRAEPFGASPRYSPVPGQQQSWAPQTPGSAPAQPLWHPAPYSNWELVPKQMH